MCHERFSAKKLNKLFLRNSYKIGPWTLLSKVKCLASLLYLWQKHGEIYFLNCRPTGITQAMKDDMDKRNYWIAKTTLIVYLPFAEASPVLDCGCALANRIRASLFYGTSNRGVALRTLLLSSWLCQGSYLRNELI